MFTHPHRSSRLRKVAALLTVTAATAVVLGSTTSAASAADEDAAIITQAIDQTAAEGVTEAPVAETAVADTPATEASDVETPGTELPEASVVTAAAETVAMLDAPVIAPMAAGSVKTTDHTGTVVNGSIYKSKDDVYVRAQGLDDGDYYVRVISPGGDVVGTSVGTDTPTPIEVVNGESINYRLSALVIMSDGSPGFDDTTNNGGEYKVEVSDTADFDHKKSDNFKVEPALPEVEPGRVSGAKYYDTNTDGDWDTGEPGIPNWPIEYSAADGMTVTVYTELDGTFSVELAPGDYTFAEDQAAAPWMQTGPVKNRTYEVPVQDGDIIDDIEFGNVALGAGGGHTLGFWSNKNGQALIGTADLAKLSADNLVDAKGIPFNPTEYAKLRAWLLNATATNMSYMLSAQLVAMDLNVFNGFVNGNALVYAPGADSANANGFASVNAVMAEANAALEADGNGLAGNPIRAHQEALKNALDNANNNINFVLASAAAPLPQFPVG